MTASNAPVLVAVSNNAQMAVNLLAPGRCNLPDTGIPVGFGHFSIVESAVFWQS